MKKNERIIDGWTLADAKKRIAALKDAHDELSSARDALAEIDYSDEFKTLGYMLTVLKIDIAQMGMIVKELETERVLEEQT